MSLQNKKIILAVSGGIAAYKVPEIVRQLKKQGAQVRVILTKAAKEFVSELSLQTVSQQAVLTELFDHESERLMNHIELAKWADFILIAPCTANLISKIRIGLADDLLTTLILATKAQIALAPAMNQQMYHAPIIQQHLTELKNRGLLIFGPASGEQACGDVGFGRMSAPEELIQLCIASFNQDRGLQGKTIVITAGPTQEAIDPVRYISNHSSGKMGFALADQAAKMGAKVILIAGPVALETPYNVTRINVTTALEMNEKALQFAQESTVFIGCAAVADYRPMEVALQKIKKQTSDQNETLTIKLIKNPDIIANVASLPKKDRPFVVGFAAETEQLSEYAQKKLKQKKLDMICANDVSNQKIGFNSEYNALIIYLPDHKEIVLPTAPKLEIARQILQEIRQINND